MTFEIGWALASLALSLLLLWKYVYGKSNDADGVLNVARGRGEGEPAAGGVPLRPATPPEARRVVPPPQLDNRPPPLDLSPDGEPVLSRSAHFSAAAPRTQEPDEQQLPPSPAVSQDDEDMLALGQLLEFQKLLVNRGLVLQRIKLSSHTEGKAGAPKERVLMMHRVDTDRADHRIDDAVYLQWTTRSHGWGLRKMMRKPRRLLLQGLEVRELYRDSSNVKRLRPGLPAEKSFNHSTNVPNALSAKVALRNAVSKTARVKQSDKVLCLVLSFHDGPRCDMYEVQAASDVELRWISRMLKGLVKVKEEAAVDAEFDAAAALLRAEGDDYSADDSTAETDVSGGLSLGPYAGGGSILSASAGGAPRYSRQAQSFFHVPPQSPQSPQPEMGGQDHRHNHAFSPPPS